MTKRTLPPELEEIAKQHVRDIGRLPLEFLRLYYNGLHDYYRCIGDIFDVSAVNNRLLVAMHKREEMSAFYKR